MNKKIIKLVLSSGLLANSIVLAGLVLNLVETRGGVVPFSSRCLSV